MFIGLHARSDVQEQGMSQDYQQVEANMMETMEQLDQYNGQMQSSSSGGGSFQLTSREWKREPASLGDTIDDFGTAIHDWTKSLVTSVTDPLNGRQ